MLMVFAFLKNSRDTRRPPLGPRKNVAMMTDGRTDTLPVSRRQLMLGAITVSVSAETRQSVPTFRRVPSPWPDILIRLPPFAVASLPSIEDIRRFASLGFKVLVNNTPDADPPDQMCSDAMAKEAERLGMTYAYIPLVDGHIEIEHLGQFNWLPKYEPTVACCANPEHAYCLWAAEQVLSFGRDPRHLMEAAEQSGFRLEELPPTVARLYVTML
jgi:uncharacterized protein (TIGR01244 family)